MFMLEAFAFGFFFMLGVEVALGLCFAIKYVTRRKKK